MRASLEFLLGLMDRDEPAYVAREDLDGEHRSAVQLWREMAFLRGEPGLHPAPSCPHCEQGVPYRCGERYVCNHCRSRVDPQHLLLWQIDREPFLTWLAAQLGLRGGIRRIDDRLWQLGAWDDREAVFECFYRRSGLLSEAAEKRLAAYRNALILSGAPLPTRATPPTVPTISLVEVLRLEGSLTVFGLARLLRKRGDVRFDPQSGALWVGDVLLGEVPVGSKEFVFLDYLAHHLDSFMSYADIKHAILRQSGSRDETEEATFCQNLKSRIKKKWIAKIDVVLVTTNKADGYRLRGHAEA